MNFLKSLQKSNPKFQGIPWHIIGYKHLIIHPETGELQVVNTFHVFVMLKKENKEAAVNVALMSRSLEIFSISNPQIDLFFFRSDFDVAEKRIKIKIQNSTLNS